MPKSGTEACARWVRAVRRTLSLSLVLTLGPLSGRAQDLTTPTQNATAGAAVFGIKGCVKCHAVSGLGESLGPDLRLAARARTFQDLSATLWNHFPQMVERMDELGIERPGLNPREAGDLVAYLYTLDYFGLPGDAENGRDIFSEKKCVMCHQVGGIGGVVGPDLDYIGGRGVPIEMATAMWNHGPAMSEAARARGIDRPSFTGAELNDLVAYFESASSATPDEDVHVLPGRAGEGKRVLTEKGCLNCHGVAGAGGRLAPDLADRERSGSLTDFVAAMWNKAPAMLAAIEKRGGYFPELRPEEVADLVGYLYSVRYFSGSGSPGEGQTLIRQKGCTGCHSFEGRGGDAAPDLSEATGLALPASVMAALWNHAVVALPTPEQPAAAWPSFTGTEMTDLMSYFQAISR